MWQKLPEEGKARYKAMAQADKDRYVGEMEAHNYRWAVRPCGSCRARVSESTRYKMSGGSRLQQPQLGFWLPCQDRMATRPLEGHTPLGCLKQ